MARAAVDTSSGDTEEQILAAALELFSESGFDGTKMRDIAARADVTLGLLQYYFGGKQKLWRAAVDRAFQDMNAALQTLLSSDRVGDDRELLRLVVRSHVAFVAQRPEFVRLMHEEGKRRGPRMRWLVDRHVKPMFDLILPMVERAQAAGAIPSGVPPVHFIYIFIGAVGVIFHQSEECKRITGIDPFTPAAVEAHSRAVETVLLGPPSEEGS